jgi:hypothetical protein
VDQPRLELQKLESLTTGTKVGIGVATGCDDVYIIDDPDVVEEDRLLPLLQSADIATGSVEWGGNYLANPWDNGRLVDLGESRGRAGTRSRASSLPRCRTPTPGSHRRSRAAMTQKKRQSKELSAAIQNGKGDWFNNVLATLLENCSGIDTLYVRRRVPGLIIPEHNLDGVYPGDEAREIEFLLEAKMMGTPKHANSPGEKPVGRAGSADTNKRVKELAFKSIDLKGEAARRLTMVGISPTSGGAGGGDLSTWLHASRPRIYFFMAVRVVGDSDFAGSFDGRRPPLRSSMPSASTAMSRQAGTSRASPSSRHPDGLRARACAVSGVHRVAGPAGGAASPHRARRWTELGGTGGTPDRRSVEERRVMFDANALGCFHIRAGSC